jgi:pimeloyl-ACP methyl ester carboxylesterase
MLESQVTRFGLLAADDYGDRTDRPLVFLHGLGFSRRHWTPAIRELEAIDPGRRAISFDLPGHGDSPALGGYGMKELVEILHDAVEAAQIAPPVVVGHSIGGALATIYAAKYPTSGVVNVDQLLLPVGFVNRLREIEPVLRGPDYAQVWESMLAGMGIGQLPPSARELVMAEPFPAADILLGYWNDLLVTPVEELVRNRTDELAALHAAGTAYRFVAGEEPPATYREWLTSKLPDAEITIIPGTGHFPQLARPAEVARLLA